MATAEQFKKAANKRGKRVADNIEPEIKEEDESKQELTWSQQQEKIKQDMEQTAISICNRKTTVEELLAVREKATTDKEQASKLVDILAKSVTAWDRPEWETVLNALQTFKKDNDYSHIAAFFIAHLDDDDFGDVLQESFTKGNWANKYLTDAAFDRIKQCNAIVNETWKRNKKPTPVKVAKADSYLDEY